MTLDEKMAEICRLLGEMYDNYFEKGDGHCKSSEGNVELVYDFGNHWDRLPSEKARESWQRDHVQQVGVPKGPAVVIYSYIFDLESGGRQHYFDTVDEALDALRAEHAAEMAHDYSEDGW